MFGVIAEKDNRFDVRVGVTHLNITSEQFMTETLGDLLYMGDVKFYMADMKLWGFSMLKALQDMDFCDITEECLTRNILPKPKFGEFFYTVGATTGAWFCLKATSPKGTMEIYSFENFVPIDTDMLVSDFCDGMDDLETITVGMEKAVQMMLDLGCTQSTVSSSAMSLWRKTHNKYDFTSLYRDIQGEEQDFVRSAYHGGFCYVNKDDGSPLRVEHGIVLDCNSLYPWVMATQPLPVGKGLWFDGEPKRLWTNDEHYGYFVRFSCRFNLKEDHVPFVRIVDSDVYRYDEILSTSDIYDPGTDSYYDELVDEDGVIHPIRATLTMWKDEFILFQEHYDIEDIQFIGGYRYMTTKKAFVKYINTFKEKKENAKTKADRRIAKIMMNSLSGGLAKKLNRESMFFTEKDIKSLVSFGGYQKSEHTSGRRTAATCDDYGHRRYVDLTTDEIVCQIGNRIMTHSRSRSYINLGAAITSIGMVTTVRAAQVNYEHYLYSDTDSVHLDCGIEDIVGIKIDDTVMGAWKIEHEFSKAVYIQPKVYYIRDLKEGPTLKWSGMKDDSRHLLEQAILYLETESEENPFFQVDIDKAQFDGMTDGDMRHIKKQLKKSTVVRIPGVQWEMVDFVHYKKSIVDVSYAVDISTFI